MRRGLSTALATAALLNLWAATAGPLARGPAPPAGPAAQAPPAAPAVTPPAAASQAAPAPAATPTPQGGRAAGDTATGDAPQPRTNDVHVEAKVKSAGAGSVSIKDFSF